MATVVEGDPKVPFWIATTLRCRGGRYSFSWIAPLYHWSVPYNAQCWYKFEPKSLVQIWTQVFGTNLNPSLWYKFEPKSPGPLVNTQTLMPMFGISWTNLIHLIILILSLRVLGLLFSSLLLFPQRFGRYVFRPFSGVCRRCPWSTGYRRRKWTRRHKFKSWTSLTAFHIALIPLEKVWIQLFSLQLWVNSRVD